MARTTQARDNAIETTILLLRRKGYEASGLTEILAESGAPKGSFYFHFPQGKEQLALEALRVYGAAVARNIEAVAAHTAGNPAAFVNAICSGVAAELHGSDWQLGCAVQNVANEMPSKAMREAAAEILATWRGVLARGLARRVEDAPAKEAQADVFLAALEGARTLARASRSNAVFTAMAEMFASAVSTGVNG